jgi:NADPH2:quinone reductase
MVVTQFCEPAEMKMVKLGDPDPGPGHIAIDVRAIGCNFFDILMIQGKYQVRPPFPFSPGSEVSGVVRALGQGVKGFKPGDRVFAILPWSGYASLALAPDTGVYPLPQSMTFEQGAAFGIAYQTAYFALVHRANLKPGETLLVHGAAGGVGLAAVQLGKALGARVLATASTTKKMDVARAAGADEAFDCRGPEWVDQVKKATSNKGADIIYDPVGGDLFDLSTKCIAFSGRLVVIGFAAGRIPSIEANKILLKNISVVGLHWGAYRQHDPALIVKTMQTLFEMHNRGQIKPVVSFTYPLSNAAIALEQITSRRAIGKVVLHP